MAPFSETGTYILALKRLDYMSLFSPNKFYQDSCFVLLPYAWVILMDIPALIYNI